MDYNTLVDVKTTEGSIKSWVNRTDVPSSSIVQMAQALIYSRLRVREMVELDSRSIMQGDHTDTVPDRFLAPIIVKRKNPVMGEIVYLDQEHFESRLAFDDDGNKFEGIPDQYTISANAISFNYRASEDITYRIWYFKTPTALSTTNTTNFLTDRYPHMLLAGCLHWAFDHMEAEEQSDRQLKKCLAYIDQANIEYSMDVENMRQEKYWRQVP